MSIYLVGATTILRRPLLRHAEPTQIQNDYFEYVRKIQNQKISICFWCVYIYIKCINSPRWNDKYPGLPHLEQASQAVCKLSSSLLCSHSGLVSLRLLAAQKHISEGKTRCRPQQILMVNTSLRMQEMYISLEFEAFQAHLQKPSSASHYKGSLS